MKLHSLFVILFSFILAACNLGVSAPQESELATAAALTVEAVLTTPTQDGPPAGAPGFAVTPSPVCEENFNIVRWERNGITYDKAEVDKPLDPNEGFEMSWVIKNTGTCTWTDAYTMNFDSGERLTPTDSFNPIPLGEIVLPGSEMAFSVPMAAPSQTGTFETTFRMDSSNGERVLFVGIITTVGKETSRVNGLSAPGELRYSYDCSGGATRINITWQDLADNESGYRIYRDGVALVDLPAGTTTFEDTTAAPGSYQYVVAAFNKEGESTSKLHVETSNCQ
ncbi:MAG: hypothetical protein H6635_00565 [Anaerolineales bacterium]|nr:hypothetical protein [Anaerolineales bacterium]MCB9143834.1 hypothetical protein [Anaerolineales bacterium]